MSPYSVLFTVIVLGVGAYFGVLRPTGLAAECALNAKKTSDAIWRLIGLIKTTGKNKGRLSWRPLSYHPSMECRTLAQNGHAEPA
jgi:hypothetical protein